MTIPRYKKIELDDCDNDELHSGGERNCENNVMLLNDLRSNTIERRKKAFIFEKCALSTGLICIYFSLSIGLIFYQRSFLKSFKFPLTTVIYHLFIKLILSALVRVLYRCITGKSRTLLDWGTFVRKLGPTGLASGIDIGFSNWGLQLVTVSLYTMTKSTTILFILLFAIMLKLEKKSWILVVIVLQIAGGLFLFTYKSTQFNVLGFSFLLIASLTSGIRWSLAQLIMQKSKIGLHHPVDMVFHMQPWMILSMIPFVLAFESGKLVHELAENYSESEQILGLLGKLSIGAFLAFFMELSEFLVVSYTSSLTLSMAGIFKDIFQLVLAVEVNHNEMTFMNVLGLSVCLSGIALHLVHKYRIIAQKATELESLEANYADLDLGSRKLNGSVAVQSEEQNGISQSIPLLDNQIDTDSDGDNPLEDDSNEVLFHIMQRRTGSANI